MSVLPAILLVATIAGLVAFFVSRRKAQNIPSFAWDIGPTIDGRSYSAGYGDPQPLDGGECQFDFLPGQYCHVHYLTRDCSALAGSLVIEFEVIGDAAFYELGGAPARVVPYFADRRNDWQTPDYRWWAKDFITEPLAEGRYSITVPLQVQHWSNVYAGQEVAGFSNALSNASRFGLTFGGGNHYGHGVWADGPATFKLRRFEVA